MSDAGCHIAVEARLGVAEWKVSKTGRSTRSSGGHGEPRPDAHHKDIELFAVMSGDINPTHLDDAFAQSDAFHKVVATACGAR